MLSTSPLHRPQLRFVLGCAVAVVMLLGLAGTASARPFYYIVKLQQRQGAAV